MLSFNGSMLISAFFGLIDNQNHQMYFLNAEHPFTVLYRNGRARFIENEEHLLTKIGTTVTQGEFKIKRFQFKEGDQIITGSDGRDDIRMGSESLINENEELILGMIEESKGNIHDLHKLIANAGEITDDLSLASITLKTAN